MDFSVNRTHWNRAIDRVEQVVEATRSVPDWGVALIVLGAFMLLLMIVHVCMTLVIGPLALGRKVLTSRKPKHTERKPLVEENPHDSRASDAQL